MLTYTFRGKREKARTGGKNESVEERRTRDGKLARQEAAVSGVRDDILMMNLFPKEKQAGARFVADWWGCGIEFSVHDRMNEKSKRKPISWCIVSGFVLPRWLFSKRRVGAVFLSL